MTNLTRFTTQYKSADDRILITGENRHGEGVSLWLTQRLLLKTVPVLVDWLQKNEPADLKANSNSEQAQAMAKVFTRKSVRPGTASTSDASANLAEAHVPETESPILVHSVDLNLNASMLRIRFRQADRELAGLAMNGSQLRQWLAVLQVLWKNAGWPSHIWPRWLSDDVGLISNKNYGSFH